MKYDYFLLDVDDTLLDFGAGMKAAFREAFEQSGILYEEQYLPAFDEINNTLWRQLERGEIKLSDLLVRRFALLRERFGLPFDPPEFNALFLGQLAENCVLMLGAQELCAALCRKGKLYLISNATVAAQRPKLRKSGLLPYISGVFLSEEVGAAKPDKVFFEHVFAAAGIPDKRRAIVLGDSLSSDMRGARDYGVPCCWFCRDENMPDTPGLYDFRVSRLIDFLELI